MTDVSSDESDDSQFSVLDRKSIGKVSNPYKEENEKNKVVPLKTKIEEEHSISDLDSSSHDCSGILKILPKIKNTESTIRHSINRPASLGYVSNLVESNSNCLSQEETKNVSKTSLISDSFSRTSTVIRNSSDYFESESSNESYKVSDSYNEESKGSVRDASSSKEKTWLNQLKSKMTPVQHLADADHSKALHLEEISNDDDIYIIQCSKEIDLESLRKNEVILNDSSSISVKIDGHSSRYDSFIANSKSESQVDLLLRSKENSKLQLGKFSLSGCLIWSQSIHVPVLTKPAKSPVKRVPYPEKLEKNCLSLQVAESPSGSSNSCNVPELKNKRKKKIKSERDISCSSDSGIESPRKKHILEDSNLQMNSFNVSSVDALLSNMKKKKKNKKIKEEYFEPEDYEVMPPSPEIAFENYKKRRSNDTLNENISNSFEYPGSEDHLTNNHRKRKKKYRDSDTTAAENYFDGITIKTDPIDRFDEGDSQLVRKKKKKSRDQEVQDIPVKHEPVEDSNLEINSFNVSSVDALLSNMKKKKKNKKIKEEYHEPEDSEIMPPPPQTAFENHKKRRRSSDSSNENLLKPLECPRTEDSDAIIHKKRKKKHRDSDSPAMENSFERIKIKTEPEDSFGGRDNQIDQSVKKKKKKKKSTDSDCPVMENSFEGIKIKSEPEDSFVN